MRRGAHGTKRQISDPLAAVQAENRAWWEQTPMSYDWRSSVPEREPPLEWFDAQDERSKAVHSHFATATRPFDRLIPFEELRGRSVLEIGVGSGFHAELLTRAGADVTGIDLTEMAVSLTRRRFALKGLPGSFQRWDAEEPRDEFLQRFDFIWSWGVIHHSARTARIVRNVADWLTADGRFAGMVYHRDSSVAAAMLIFHGVLRGKLLSQTVDEILWRNSDGFSARFYPVEQWQDLLLGFFGEASVGVAGGEGDVLPLPRRLRRLLVNRISDRRRDRILARAGSFITFEASSPLRSEV